MAIGAYYTDNSAGTSTYYSPGYTVCEVGTFNAAVILRSLRFRAYNTGTFSGKAVCYNNAGTKLGEGPSTMFNYVHGVTYNLEFNSGIEIAAGTTVKIGFYQSAGSSYPSVFSTSSTVPDATTPAWCSWTRQSNQMFATADANPTNYTTYCITGGFTLDKPNLAPQIQLFYPSSAKYSPLDPLLMTWYYYDPEGLPMQTAELSWRYINEANPKTWNSDPTWTTLVTLTGNPAPSTYEIPANTWPLDSKVCLRLRVSDGVNWSGYAERDLDFDGWGLWDTDWGISGVPATVPNLGTGLKRGQWQQRIRVANSVGQYTWGPYSAAQSFDSQGPTDRYVLKGGLWHAIPKLYKSGGSWVYPSS